MSSMTSRPWYFDRRKTRENPESSDVGTSATRSRKTVGAKRAEGRNPTRLLDKQSEERLKHRYHKAGAEHGRAEIRQFEQGFPLFVVEQSNNLAHDRSPLAR